MDDRTFKHLTADVSIGRYHPNYFLWCGDVCNVICTRFPARQQDFALRGIEEDGDGRPYLDMQLDGVNLDDLTMLVSQAVAL